MDRSAGLFRQAAGGIDDAYGGVVRAGVAAVLNRLDNLGSLRELTLSTGLPATAAVSTYTNVATDILDLQSVISEGSVDASLNGTSRVLAVSTEKERFAAACALAVRSSRRPVPPWVR